MRHFHFSNSLNFLVSHFQTQHCVESVRIWSYSGPYLPTFGLNTDQNNFEHGHFSCSEKYSSVRMNTSWSCYITSNCFTRVLNVRILWFIWGKMQVYYFPKCFMRFSNFSSAVSFSLSNLVNITNIWLAFCLSKSLFLFHKPKNLLKHSRKSLCSIIPSDWNFVD